MHNLTPLGISMHLKELERQALPQVRSLRATPHSPRRVAALGAAARALLRRLDAAVSHVTGVTQATPRMP